MKMTILNIVFVAGPVILALVAPRTAAARRRARLWQAQVDWAEAMDRSSTRDP